MALHSLTLTPRTPFDLEKTLSCGQVFRWEVHDGWWTGVVGDKVIRIRQDEPRLTWEGADRAFISRYFSLDLDLSPVLQGIDKDPVIHRAIESCRGLRIIRQPPWECLASYIIATFSNIPSIKRRIALMCREFGEEICVHGSTYYSFPFPDLLAGEEKCLQKTCRLGYRAPFLCETAQVLAGHPGWEEELRALPYEDARKVLQEYKGIGKKVADCVLLFGFGRLESVPVDVWIERILRKYYLQDMKDASNYEYMRRFAQGYFGAYAGYAQEYLFTMREYLC
jgi:N-glycosylase/DNA lyase